MKSNLTIAESKKVWDALHKDYPDGRIPMSTFNIVEKDVRPYMRSANLRAMYRGPRISNHCKDVPSMTMRRDATHVVLIYSRN